MKVVKISLVIIVVAAIAFFVIQSLVSIDEPAKITEPKNQFTQRIDQEIDSLTKLPITKFCKDFYEEISYHINSYHKEERLGTTPSGNDQWKENLSSDLYNAYADKFIDQAFYVFKKNEWPFRDLRFIRSEYKELRKSNFLKRNSEVDKKLTEIKSILSKYDEINKFINTNKNFIATTNNILDSDSGLSLSSRFPILDIKEKIAQANVYLSNRLENTYVNNCQLLHNELKEIPQEILNLHVNYLDKKISHWSNFYSNYNSQSDYVNNLYKPLKIEIEELDNDIYNVEDLEEKYKLLLDKWNKDITNAYNYSYPTNN